MGILRSASCTYTMPSVVRKKASVYTARLVLFSLLAYGSNIKDSTDCGAGIQLAAGWSHCLPCLPLCCTPHPLRCADAMQAVLRAHRATDANASMIFGSCSDSHQYLRAAAACNLLLACCTAPPTDVGSADAMLAKMRMEVPLPSFSSVITSAVCSTRDLYSTTRTGTHARLQLRDHVRSLRLRRVPVSPQKSRSSCHCTTSSQARAQARPNVDNETMKLKLSIHNCVL